MLCWGIAFQLRRRSKAINLKALLNCSYLTLWRFSSKGLFCIIAFVPFYLALKGGLRRWIPRSRNTLEQIRNVDFFFQKMREKEINSFSWSWFMLIHKNADNLIPATGGGGSVITWKCIKELHRGHRWLQEFVCCEAQSVHGPETVGVKCSAIYLKALQRSHGLKQNCYYT